VQYFNARLSVERGERIPEPERLLFLDLEVKSN
jgi:hypothetical protein